MVGAPAMPNAEVIVLEREHSVTRIPQSFWGTSPHKERLLLGELLPTGDEPLEEHDHSASLALKF